MNAPFLGGFLCGVLFELAVTGIAIIAMNIADRIRYKKRQAEIDKAMERKLLIQAGRGLRNRK